jgi:hypothetical protein
MDNRIHPPPLLLLLLLLLAHLLAKKCVEWFHRREW